MSRWVWLVVGILALLLISRWVWLVGWIADEQVGVVSGVDS